MLATKWLRWYKNQCEQVKTIFKTNKNGYAGIKNQSEQVKTILKTDKNGYTGINIVVSKDNKRFGMVENNLTVISPMNFFVQVTKSF